MLCWVTQSCLTLCDPFSLCSPLGFSVHGIFQTRIPEWVAILSSEPRDWTWVSFVSWITGRFFSLGHLKFFITKYYQKAQWFHGHIFWRTKRHYCIPEASLTHCNRKGLGMFNCEIMTVLFLPFGWTISCLSRNLYQGTHIPAVLHLCFQQVGYCPDQNLKLPTGTEDPEYSHDWGSGKYPCRSCVQQLTRYHRCIPWTWPVTNIVRNSQRTMLILGKTF